MKLSRPTVPKTQLSDHSHNQNDFPRSREAVACFTASRLLCIIATGRHPLLWLLACSITCGRLIYHTRGERGGVGGTLSNNAGQIRNEPAPAGLS